jgi:methionyl-tRNA formyltransferase
MARIVFMGSPAFAVPTLDALAQDHEVLAVFTQPDRPAGRGRRLARVPVAAWAEQHGVPINQPRSLRRDAAALDGLEALRPDVIVVVAYGLILPGTVLEVSQHGCLNVHASLLPKYRGAAPIPAAILAGDDETGVTIMRMDAGVDTGPILARAREPIRADDTTLSLGERLARLGARLMVDTLPRYLRGDITPAAQDDALASPSPKIEKADGRIRWSQPAIHLDRMIRAYTPWPGAHTDWNGRQLKIVRAVPTGQMAAKTLRPAGQVIQLDAGRVGVVAGDSVLKLGEVQLAGKRAMSIEEFVRGHTEFIGSILGFQDE